jgi:aminoglycoside phosphotransferase (APT) family kinase protein
LEALNKYNASLKEGDRAVKGVPVPRVYCLCMDKEVVGAGFYVMDFLEGRIFQNIFMKEVNDEDRRAW